MPPCAQDPCFRPTVFQRAPSAPARSVRVSHDSDPASGHAPCPKPKPLLLPNPNPYAPAGRRGRKEGARLTMLPTSTITGSAPVYLWAPNPNL